jgi:Ca2+-binding EF-hand superfamily protein
MTTKPVSMVQSAEPDVNTLLIKVQCRAITDGRRVVDFFKGFDRLNSGRVTCNVFERGLNLAEVGLNADEIAVLAVAYTGTPGHCDYARFSSDVESACAPLALEQNPLGGTQTLTPLTRIELTALERKTKSSNTGTTLSLDDALYTVGNLCRLRRVELLGAFQDFDSTKNGSISQNHFARVLDKLGIQLPPAQLSALVQKYEVQIGGQQDVHYRNFAADVDSRAHILHALTTGAM